MPEGHVAIQRDLNKLEKQDDKNLNKEVQEAEGPSPATLGRNSATNQSMLGDTQVESSFAEKDLGVLVDTKLHISQQCTLVAKMTNGILGCSRRSAASNFQKLSAHGPGQPATGGFA
ncbi:mitochondrial enolase superfamily member 1 [Grus japonensis]|uniref:Mitochondrial enolase superfamily member 1 n=1 Tax=Grus japonensis TaxID=30415 RepID=A0ABC9VRQ7_GRUJA